MKSCSFYKKALPDQAVFLWKKKFYIYNKIHSKVVKQWENVHLQQIHKWW